MSNPKHTPGPWRVETDGLIIARDATAVVNCYPYPNSGEQLANQRLIAAAPDLLGFVESLGHLENDCSDEQIARVLSEARELIRKATGGAE